MASSTEIIGMPLCYMDLTGHEYAQRDNFVHTITTDDDATHIWRLGDGREVMRVTADATVFMIDADGNATAIGQFSTTGSHDDWVYTHTDNGELEYVSGKPSVKGFKYNARTTDLLRAERDVFLALMRFKGVFK